MRNPGTMQATIKRTAVSIIKVKSPSVSTVIGKERKIKPGFTKIFNNATTIATNKAVQKELTETPGIRQAQAKIANPDIKSLQKGLNI